MQIFSNQFAIEGDELNVSIYHAIDFIVVDEFVVQISFGDVFSLSHQTECYLNDLKHASNSADSIKVNHHSILFEILVSQCIKAEFLEISIQWELK